MLRRDQLALTQGKRLFCDVIQLLFKFQFNIILDRFDGRKGIPFKYILYIKTICDDIY